MQRRYLIAVVLLALVGAYFLLRHLGYFIGYGVDIVNHGQSGVIILELGQEEAFVRRPFRVMGGDGKERWSYPDVPEGLKELPVVIAMYPTIPSEYRDPTTAFGRFTGYERTLPTDLEVVWQLAELRECSDTVWVRSEETTRELKSRGYNPADHVNKSGCTWVLLPDKIFRKKLNLREIRDTAAYKRAGKRNPFVALSHYTLGINLIFMEDQLKVEAYTGSTNPWR